MPRKILNKRLLMIIVGIFAIVMFTASYFMPLILGLKGSHGNVQTSFPSKCSWITLREGITDVPGMPGVEVYVRIVPGSNNTDIMTVNIINRKNEAVALVFKHNPVISLHAIDNTGALATLIATRPGNTTTRPLAPMQALQLRIGVPSDEGIIGYIITIPDLKIKMIVWNNIPRDVICGYKNLGFEGGMLSIRWIMSYQGLVAVDPIIIATSPIVSIEIPANTTIYTVKMYDRNGKTVFFHMQESGKKNERITLYSAGATSGVMVLGPHATSLLGEPTLLEFSTNLRIAGLKTTKYIESLPQWTDKWPGKWIYYSESTKISDKLTYIASLSYNGYYVVVNSTIINNSSEKLNITGKLVFSSDGIRALWFNATVYDVTGNIISRYPRGVHQEFPLVINMDPNQSYSTTVVLPAPYRDSANLVIHVINKTVTINLKQVKS